MAMIKVLYQWSEDGIEELCVVMEVLDGHSK